MCGAQQKSVLGVFGWVAGVLAVLAVIGFWVVESGRTFLGFEADHLFRDAVLLFLMSFWLRWTAKAVACSKMSGDAKSNNGGHGGCCS